MSDSNQQRRGIDRRAFLAGAGLAAAGSALGLGCEAEKNHETTRASVTSLDVSDWESVRRQFNLSQDKIHYTLFLIASHPAPVREAIEAHRTRLNEEPIPYLQDENIALKYEARQAAAEYLGVRADEVALTDSTTMGLGLVYNGLVLEEGQEVLTTEHDYYSTHASLRLAVERSGASMRRITLYDDPATVTEEEILANLQGQIRPETRLLALTWVHSMNGVKLPLGSISEVVAEANRGRAEEDRLLLGVDAVHGLGVEDVVIDDLGCDFFIAGCHKWLCGPRGTGIVWARPEAWAATRPTIPSFVEDESWNAWAEGREPGGPNNASRMTPGGFKPFEHQWAIADAFRFHLEVGKSRIESRTHELNRQLKEGLAAMDHVDLHTPVSEALSAGMVCFDVDGLTPVDVRNYLRDHDITATITPYAVSHARLGPSIANTPEEIERTLEVLRGVA